MGVGSNPSSVYWMAFLRLFVVKIVMFVSIEKNKRERGRGGPILKKSDFLHVNKFKSRQWDKLRR